jgi:hypothetical protein
MLKNSNQNSIVHTAQTNRRTAELRVFLAAAALAALPAFAATSCPAPQVLAGSNCTFSMSLGWATAGQGSDSILTIFVPPNASGPVTFHVTALNSNLGSRYTGYFGIRAGFIGQPGQVLTLSDMVAGGPADIGQLPPGQVLQASITEVCWDPTCTAPAPPGAVPNMFSVQFIESSPNSADINPNDIQGTVRLLNGSQVNFETTEPAMHTDSPFSIVPGISLGATPDTRYVFNSSAVTMPFDAISISNLDNSGSINGTVDIQDLNGNVIATANIPPIAPNGAAGFLLVGQNPGDTLGLFPSSTVFPAGPDGIFHGTLVIHLNGLVVNGQCIVLAQEYNGNSMVNLPVYHSPIR